MEFVHVDGIPAVETDVVNGPSGRFYLSPTTKQLYPSITTILGVESAPHIENWRRMLGAEKASKITTACANRGTAVHDLTERYLKNQAIDYSGYEPAHVSDFNKLKLALNKINNIVLQESVLYNDTLRVAGRVDCVAEYDGGLAIIDFKTSTKIKTKDQIQSYWKQTCFYALAFEEMYGVQINDLVILMSVEQGLMPLVYKDVVDNHIEALVQTVDKYHKSKGT